MSNKIWLKLYYTKYVGKQYTVYYSILMDYVYTAVRNEASSYTTAALFCHVTWYELCDDIAKWYHVVNQNPSWEAKIRAASETTFRLSWFTAVFTRSNNPFPSWVMWTLSQLSFPMYLSFALILPWSLCFGLSVAPSIWGFLLWTCSCTYKQHSCRVDSCYVLCKECMMCASRTGALKI